VTQVRRSGVEAGVDVPAREYLLRLEINLDSCVNQIEMPSEMYPEYFT
jgi:hypothetical protein